MDKNTRNGVVLILLSALAYALFPIFTKLFYESSDISPLDLAVWRFAIAVPLIWLLSTVWMRVTQPPKLEKPLPRRALMLTGVLAMCAAIVSFFGLELLDASVYVVLFFTYPAITAVINAIRGEPLSGRGWLALGMTMFGVVLTVLDPGDLRGALADISPMGASLALLNALLIAVFVIVNARVQRGYPSTARASAWTMTGTLFVIPFIVVARGLQVPENAAAWLWLLSISTIGTVVPYFTLILGNKLLGSSRASIVATVEPALAIFFAWLLLGEILGGWQVVGAALIIASIVVLEARVGVVPAGLLAGLRSGLQKLSLPSMDKRTRTGILFALLAAGGYAFFPVFVKLIYEYSDLVATDIAGWRFIMAVPAVWVVLFARPGKNRDIQERLPRWSLMGLGVLLTCGALAAFYGLGVIDASIYVILFRTYPVMVMLLSLALGAKLPERGWLAVAVVLIGVGLMVYQPGNVEFEFTRVYLFGVLTAFINAAVIAIYNVGQERVMGGYRSKLKAGAWTLTGSLVAVVPLLLIVGLAPLPNWQTMACIAGLALFCTVLPIFAIYEGIERLGASRFVIIGSVEPLLALVLAVLLIGEAMLTPLQMLGGVLVLASIFILEMKPTAKPQAERAQVPAGD